ncbi:MAG: serine/threonine protein kinase [Armatimonadetes bacterium]|nr:serine/threonine protein kinase [Armatimonadota bacterium]
MKVALCSLILLGLLAMPALSETVELRLQTSPPGATVSVEAGKGIGSHARLVPLGQTGAEPIRLDLRALAPYFRTKGGVSQLPLVLSREGYHPQRLPIAVERLQEGYSGSEELWPVRVTVNFQTDPPGAKIAIRDVGTAVAGEDYTFVAPFDEDDGRYKPLELEIGHPGFKPQTLVLETGLVDAYRDHRWPSSVPHPLTPEGVIPWLKNEARKHPVAFAAVAVVGSGMLVGAGFLLIVRRPREKRRLDRLEALKAGADTSDPLVLSTLGRWRIVQFLGAGGMASVYKALPDETLDDSEAVAIKVMKKEISQDLEFRKRFQREVKVCRELHHKNIVRVDDFSAPEDALLYLAMEYVPGITLDKRVPKEEGLDLEEAMEYLEPIMDALTYAHERTVVHRDLKLENVMLTAAGRVVLMDFGLARSQDVSAVTQTGSAMGTPAYMAPEQIMGAAPHPSADQYSLGVMICELMTGHRPFTENDPMALIYAHLEKSPTPPREYRPNLPEAVEKVILRALAKDPARRFPSLAALKRNLENAVAGEPIDEAPPEPAKPIRGARPSADTVPRPAADGAMNETVPMPEDATLGFQAPADRPAGNETVPMPEDATLGFQAPADRPRGE